MSGPVFTGAVVGLVVGVLLTAALVLAWRLARGTRELGSDSERATFSTLHLASRAAKHLRDGLDGDDVGRAARHLRTLLGCDALAVVTPDGVVALDGPAALRSEARRVGARTIETGRRQVYTSGEPSSGTPEAVGAPVLADGVVAGAVVAFATRVRPPLVRATGEVAQWCAAQLELGELEASRTALAQAELRALRAQISPHFIYNSLGAIASFISTDPERARDLVLDFADFTRYSFRGRGDFTTLADELGSVHSYVELERARFGDRLTVTLQIAPESLSTVIPFLSVQPLVENAVRHGLEPRERGGRIVISARDEGTQTEITVEDDGVGMSPETLRTLLATGSRATNVGLRNVDTRVRQLYGDQHALEIETEEGAGTLVRMRVPKSQPQHETEVSRR
ncbi:histidine kinase [Oerskovia sp. Sa1BUA8]|uniref:Histidine kinase n=1 Tax=Oerskovia douganii TaxID=2762210 RepID=A0A9D5UI46_9CELL|nr:histidine kinase [Oerskovia douganii]MBE7701312.1 histidine kinase [Oerskovia douganii]